MGSLHALANRNQHCWSIDILDWVPMTQPGGSTGGAGDASAANQATEIAALGATTDAEATVNGSIIAILKRLRTQLGGTLSVSGTFWPATQPVSGTFWQATQPVSGTFFQTTQPVSIASMPATPVTDNGGSLTVDGSVSVSNFPATQPVSGTVTANLGTLNGAALDATLSTMSGKLPASVGQKAMAASLSVAIASDQATLPVTFAAASVLFRGRACTFRTPGRAGTAGQKLLAIHNATGSTVTVNVTKVFIDLACTVVKAITVLPPVVRCWKVTVLPTNGTSLAKTKIGGSTTSNASVTVFGDASADGTNSGTALAATLPAGAFVTQEFAPRFITGAGYEMADRLEFFGDSTVELKALEGLVLFLDYTLATQNPTTDMWTAGLEWTEAA